MDIESRIRSRIETILQNEARHSVELEEMASNDEPPAVDPLSRERGLYERIISTCRCAVTEVNRLLEENVEFLSTFCRIVETIKEKVDIEEICLDIAHAALAGLGAEYCAIALFEKAGHDPFQLEAIRDGEEFLRVHSRCSLLGSERNYEAVAKSARESTDCLNFPDVYRESRFQGIDWPSVVRSLVCVPVLRQGEAVGMAVLSHSLPAYFQMNHVRILRVLAGIISHVHLLTSAALGTVILRSRELTPPELEPPCFSVALLSFEVPEPWGTSRPDATTLSEIRSALYEVLQGRESILIHRDRELLVILPGAAAELVSGRVCALRHAFRAWKSRQPATESPLPRMSVGFAACGPSDDLSRALEVASAVMNPEEE